MVMKIECLVLGSMQTNCYLLSQDGAAAVVDPGDLPLKVLDTLQEQGLRLEAILLTHGHFDHVGGVRKIAQATGCRVYLNERDLSMPAYLTSGPLYYTDAYDEGDTVRVGPMSFQVLATPGHTLGSVCLLCGDVMLSGDTLFAGDCGRTDLDGGSWSQMLQSLKRLGQLEGDYRVFPGHGPATTLRAEQRTNGAMREALRR